MLVRAAVANDGLFHLIRRVLVERHALFLDRQQNHAPPVAHADASRDVVAPEQLLHRDGLRLHCFQQLLDVYKRQPSTKRWLSSKATGAKPRRSG